MPEVSRNERFAKPPSRVQGAFRTAALCVLMATSSVAYGDKISSIDDSSSTKQKSKPDSGGIESKICGFSGFFSVIEKEGEKIIVMHAGCTTYNGKMPIKAEFTPKSSTIIKANGNAEFMISENTYIFFSSGEPIFSYIDEDGKRINMLIKKENGIYNMRKYMKYMK